MSTRPDAENISKRLYGFFVFCNEHYNVVRSSEGRRALEFEFGFFDYYWDSVLGRAASATDYIGFSPKDRPERINRFNKTYNSKKVRAALKSSYGLEIRQVYYSPVKFYIDVAPIVSLNSRSIKASQMDKNRIVLNNVPTFVESVKNNLGALSSDTEDEDFDSTDSEIIDEYTSLIEGAEWDSKKVPNVTSNGEIFYFPSFSNEILDCIKCNDNVYISGPHGCGKSQMSRLLVEATGVSPLEIDFSVGADEAAFLGTKVAEVDNEGNNVIKFQYGVFPQAIIEDRPLIINEIDFAKPQYLASLHGILEDNDPKLVILDNGGEVLRPKKNGNFMVIATANTLGNGDESDEYQGTGALNAAFLDRFDSFFEMSYTPLEINIVKKILGNEDLSKELIGFISSIRSLKESGSLSIGISTRRLKMLAKKIKKMGLERAIRNVITNRMDVDDREAIRELGQRSFPSVFKS